MERERHWGGEEEKREGRSEVDGLERRWVGRENGLVRWEREWEGERERERERGREISYFTLMAKERDFISQALTDVLIRCSSWCMIKRRGAQGRNTEEEGTERERMREGARLRKMKARDMRKVGGMETRGERKEMESTGNDRVREGIKENEWHWRRRGEERLGWLCVEVHCEAPCHWAHCHQLQPLLTWFRGKTQVEVKKEMKQPRCGSKPGTAYRISQQSDTQLSTVEFYYLLFELSW